jgi:predicted DNA-binding antitoxin AbrB/MazE fold protein
VEQDAFKTLQRLDMQGGEKMGIPKRAPTLSEEKRKERNSFMEKLVSVIGR